MSKKKRPAEEGKDISKGYVEIPMPELVNDSFEKERVFQYGTARWAYGFLLFIIVGCVLTAVTEIPNGLFLVWGFLLILTVALLLLAKYEIRHDREGFSVCLGGRVLRRHEWSEVSGVTEKKRVLVNGKKLFADPSMSGYEAFYDRAHAAAKKKSKPQPAVQAAENPPKPTEVMDKTPKSKDEPAKSKGYIELDLSGLKDKLDDVFERLVFGSKSRKFDSSYKKGEGRLGIDSIFGKAGIVSVILTSLVLLLCVAFRADMGVVLLMGFLMLLGLFLTVIGKYEIRFDGKGFSTRFGKRILHEYKWSDVTDVQDNRKVWVQGKRLWTDHTFEDFSEFYKMARSACKGKGKPTPPSEKKQKNRKKAGK